MPSRKRHRQSPNQTPAAPVDASPAEKPASRGPKSPVDDEVLRRFNEGLRRMEQQKRDERDRKRREQQQGEALGDATKRLERAIAAVQAARQTGRGAAEAELEWRAAKSEVIFLETGSRPAWAPAPVEEVTDDGSTEADATDDDSDDEPRDESADNSAE